jgi:Bacterial aa3 type cytochrome c oxidase subunit IV
MAFPVESVGDPDFEDHLETYKAFVKWGLIFVAHVALALVLLAYFYA